MQYTKLIFNAYTIIDNLIDENLIKVEYEFNVGLIDACLFVD